MSKRLEYEEDANHTKIRLKSGLNKDISSKMILYKFEFIDDVVEAVIEIEKNLKKQKAFKSKGFSTLTSWGKNKEGVVQSSFNWNKSREFKKPFERKPLFEKDASKNVPKERVNNSSIKDPKGFQCYKCKGWGTRIVIVPIGE